MKVGFVKPGTTRRAVSKRLIAIAAASSLFLAACGGGSSDDGNGAASNGDEDTTNGEELIDVNYMMPHSISVSYVEALIAKEKGYFEDHGLNVDIKGAQGTATAIQAVLGGSVDISRTNAVNAIIATANEEAPLVSIGTVRQRSQFDVVSLAESPIRTPEELEGKTVGVVSAGGATENLLDMMLISVGVDPASVDRPITGVGTAAYELAKNGAVDAWISVDTDRELIHSTVGEVHYFNTDEYLTIPSDTFNISQATIDSGTDMPARFLAAILEAMEFGSQEENWEEVAEILEIYVPEAQTEDTLDALPMLVAGWDAGGESEFLAMPTETWETGVQRMLDAGFIEREVPASDLIDTSFLEEARELVGN